MQRPRDEKELSTTTEQKEGNMGRMVGPKEQRLGRRADHKGSYRSARGLHYILITLGSH